MDGTLWRGLARFVGIALASVACGDGGGGGALYDGGLDSGTDVDTDADTDTGTDSDTDTDTDTDTGSDTGSDTDTDTGTDTGSETDTDGDAGTDTGSDTGSEVVCVDMDSDSWCLPFDCDDGDPTVHPEADEILDSGVDEDCDGEIDELPPLEDWDMYLTVDNQFDVYFGSPTATTGAVVGGGTDWPTEYHFTAVDRLPTDYLYVATASDHLVAQGFIGTFTNVTLGKTTNTGDDVWEVFPAGAYVETNPYGTDPWPASLMPTQAQVDTAIAFAEANDLWVTPVGAPGFDNDPSTPTDPYSNPWAGAAYVNIPPAADWIWHESGACYSGLRPSPLEGYNHDEFLVFRVAGAVPGIE
jgi:hypothetical protein